MEMNNSPGLGAVVKIRQYAIYEMFSSQPGTQHHCHVSDCTVIPSYWYVSAPWVQVHIHGAFCANLSNVQWLLNWGLMDSAEGESWVLGLRNRTRRGGIPENDLLGTSSLWDPCRKGRASGSEWKPPANDKVKSSSEVILVISLLYKADSREGDSPKVLLSLLGPQMFLRIWQKPMTPTKIYILHPISGCLQTSRS